MSVINWLARLSTGEAIPESKEFLATYAAGLMPSDPTRRPAGSGTLAKIWPKLMALSWIRRQKQQTEYAKPLPAEVFGVVGS